MPDVRRSRLLRPSPELLARERDHNARRRVSTIAAIEREAAELGLGPTTRQELDGVTTIVSAAGEAIASVRLRRREDAAYQSLAGETVVARLADGSEYWPGAIALSAIGLRRAG